jgi:hypothetical protein
VRVIGGLRGRTDRKTGQRDGFCHNKTCAAQIIAAALILPRMRLHDDPQTLLSAADPLDAPCLFRLLSPLPSPSLALAITRTDE